MDTLVDRAWVSSNASPSTSTSTRPSCRTQIAKDYDRLWTDERIRKVVKAAKSGDVAIELNDRYKLPGERFVKMAKEEGLQVHLRHQ